MKTNTKIIEWTEDWHSHKQTNILLVDKTDKPIASVSIQFMKEWTCINSFYVQEHFRGQGYGTMLFDYVMALYRDSIDLSLQVKRDNDLAIKMYQRRGFDFWMSRKTNDNGYVWMSRNY